MNIPPWMKKMIDLSEVGCDGWRILIGMEKESMLDGMDCSDDVMVIDFSSFRRLRRGEKERKGKEEEI